MGAFMAPGASEEPIDGAPLVMFPPDGWSARRTVWVRPDGSTREIARQDDGWAALLMTAPFAHVGMAGLAFVSVLDDLKARNQAPAKARLKRLVAERKAEWAKRHVPTTQPDE